MARVTPFTPPRRGKRWTAVLPVGSNRRVYRAATFDAIIAQWVKDRKEGKNA